MATTESSSWGDAEDDRAARARADSSCFSSALIFICICKSVSSRAAASRRSSFVWPPEALCAASHSCVTTASSAFSGASSASLLAAVGGGAPIPGALGTEPAQLRLAVCNQVAQSAI